MSKWRKKALELIPEERQLIKSSESVGDLWCELSSVFDKSIKTNNNILIKNIIKYVTWCTSEEAGDTSSNTHQSVTCGFLEDITRNKKHFPLFKQWFNAAQFEKYKGSFMYALGEKSFKDLENIFYEK